MYILRVLKLNFCAHAPSDLSTRHPLKIVYLARTSPYSIHPVWNSEFSKALLPRRNLWNFVSFRGFRRVFVVVTPINELLVWLLFWSSTTNKYMNKYKYENKNPRVCTNIQFPYMDHAEVAVFLRRSAPWEREWEEKKTFRRTLWVSLVGLFWCIQVSFDIFWCFVGLFDVCWCFVLPSADAVSAATTASASPATQSALPATHSPRLHTATYCNKMQHTATHSDSHATQSALSATHWLRWHTATHCNTLQNTATHCNTLQHTATHCTTLQHTATYCNTLQHTATYCNTLQHTATRMQLRAPCLQHTG